MTDLDKLRDEMADVHAESENFPHEYGAFEVAVESYQTGWNALLKVLSEAAGEFDEKAARSESDNSLEIPDDHWSTPSFIYGARWQFDQMSARVGLANKLAAREIRVQQAYAVTNLELQNKCEALEARVKELERTQMKIIPMGGRK